jgi:hypothetical protein
VLRFPCLLYLAVDFYVDFAALSVFGPLQVCLKRCSTHSLSVFAGSKQERHQQQHCCR